MILYTILSSILHKTHWKCVLRLRFKRRKKGRDIKKQFVNRKCSQAEIITQWKFMFRHKNEKPRSSVNETHKKYICCWFEKNKYLLLLDFCLRFLSGTTAFTVTYIYGTTALNVCTLGWRTAWLCSCNLLCLIFVSVDIFFYQCHTSHT